jgi:D-alanyl-D-alanine carboxypeptidase
VPTNPTPRPLTPHISRRRFLQAAAWASLGLAAQACTPTSTVPPPVPWVAPTSTPTYTPTPVPTPTPTPTPTAAPTSTPEPTATPVLPVTSIPDLELIRPIGKAYPLPTDFVPSALHTLVSYPFIQVQPGRETLQGHPEAVAALSQLFEAARQAGITDLYVTSAYRSMATQAYMWESAGGAHQSRVAPPGTSEHQSGLAFDFATFQTDPYTGSPLWFEATAAHRWLRAHSHRFGFVNTYPRPGIDGILAESWHYRYVSVEISTQLYELGYLDPASTIDPIEFYASLSQQSRP